MTPHLRAPTFAESAAIENYRAATGGALAAADSVSDKVVIASFSVAVAFGAVVALVTPKGAASSYLIAAPFVLLAGAVGLALFSESIAVSIALSNDLEKVKTSVESTIRRKRLWARIALVVLACGMLAAGGVLVARYRATADKRTAVSVWLTPGGEQAVAKACDSGGPASLAGTVDDPSELASGPVAITLAAGTCGPGPVTLELQRTQIEIASRR